MTRLGCERTTQERKKKNTCPVGTPSMLTVPLGHYGEYVWLWEFFMLEDLNVALEVRPTLKALVS